MIDPSLIDDKYHSVTLLNESVKVIIDWKNKIKASIDFKELIS